MVRCLSCLTTGSSTHLTNKWFIRVAPPNHFGAQIKTNTSDLDIHQKKMLAKNLLVILFGLLDSPNTELKAKCLEIFQYFDGTFPNPTFSPEQKQPNVSEIYFVFREVSKGYYSQWRIKTNFRICEFKTYERGRFCFCWIDLKIPLSDHPL